jgi:hypothetical protein
VYDLSEAAHAPRTAKLLVTKATSSSTFLPRALLEVSKGLGERFAPLLDAELLDLVFEAIKHTNRFVRETGYYVCGQFVVILNEDKIGDTSVVSYYWSQCVAPLPLQLAPCCGKKARASLKAHLYLQNYACSPPRECRSTNSPTVCHPSWRLASPTTGVRSVLRSFCACGHPNIPNSMCA